MLLAWGQGQDAPEASAGICLVMVNSLDFRRRRREPLAPALSAEKLVPYGSKRTGLAPRPWAPWAIRPNLFPFDLRYPPVTELLPKPLYSHRSVWYSSSMEEGALFPRMTYDV